MWRQLRQLCCLLTELLRLLLWYGSEVLPEATIVSVQDVGSCTLPLRVVSASRIMV